jgi:hypothetical protein
LFAIGGLENVSSVAEMEDMILQSRRRVAIKVVEESREEKLKR